MSEHSGHSGHNHYHEPAWKGGWRYFVAAGLLSIFAGIEVYVGTSILRSPIVVADAWHNLSDVVFALASAIIAMIALAGRRNHFVHEHLPHYASIAICLLTILVIGWAVWSEAFEPIATDARSIALTAGIGLLSFMVNSGLALFLERGSNSLSASTAQHFRSDAKVSLLLVPTALLAGLVSAGSITWAPRFILLAGTLLVILSTTRDNLEQAAEFWGELRECRQNDRSDRSTDDPSI